MTESDLATRLCDLCKSLFDRGYSVGGAGNVSARTDGGFLVTPTGGSLGRLHPDGLSRIDPAGMSQPGPKPSKEFAFHHALYMARPDVGAVVHQHSTHLTALSCLEGLTMDNALRPFTPYYVMRIGRLPVIPYFRPGSPEIGPALARLALDPGCQAILMASHGVVVLGHDLDEAVNNAEELEETARLWFLLRGERIRYLSDAEVTELRGGR